MASPIKLTYNGHPVAKTGYFYNKQPEYKVVGLQDCHSGMITLVKCAKCKELVKTTVMYLDNDGKQKHYACLSEARLKEIKGE